MISHGYTELPEEEIKPGFDRYRRFIKIDNAEAGHIGRNYKPRGHFFVIREYQSSNEVFVQKFRIGDEIRGHSDRVAIVGPSKTFYDPDRDWWQGDDYYGISEFFEWLKSSSSQQTTSNRV